ncbi:MAG: DUF5320 domain-containing protein [Desulfatibacillaceae bacterium]
MPRQDGTGPEGRGPRTGRGAGRCRKGTGNRTGTGRGAGGTQASELRRKNQRRNREDR